ncbi:UBN2 domain-containing protein [Tanacetum coccineum]
MASTRASISKASKRPKINIIPSKQLFVDLTHDNIKTPSPTLQLSSPSAPNAPSKTPSTKDTSSSIFIRKKKLYVVGLQDYWGKIYEIGKLGQYNRYFTHADQTGFGEQYEKLFRGSEGNLCGTWVGYDVLNEAITRVMLHWDDPSAWAWSCGVFALMFSEPCRSEERFPFVLERRKRPIMRILKPNLIRKNTPIAEKLEFYKRRAQDSLNVHLWQALEMEALVDVMDVDNG